jgi:regulator of sigma E protease
MSIGLLGGLTFVMVFAGMILIHEFGHFIVARLFHIEIEEFGIGFPPRILTLFTWKGTRFTLNWIPLGGFVRPRGEDDPAVPGGLAAANPWKRIAVLFAGPTMNLLTAIFVYTLLFSQVGSPDARTVVIADVLSGSPAATAGLQTNDIVLTAASEDIRNVKQLYSVTHAHLDEPILLTLQRGDKVIEIIVTPSSQRTETEGAMGVLLGNPFRPVSSYFETIPFSIQETYYTINDLLSLPGRIVGGAIKPDEARLAGPRSIWNLFQQAVTRDVQSRQQTETGQTEAPTNYTLTLIISLTISLGVINLLPIPAMDGGRIFLTLSEIIMRKPLPAKIQNTVNGIGFIVLLALLSYFYVMDFINPIHITLP